MDFNNFDSITIDDRGDFICKRGNEVVCIPDTMDNRHRKDLQEWIDAGNTPDPYVEPEPHWIDKRLANMANGGYGSIGEQLEMIGEQGMDVYQSHIAKVKTDIPKE